MALEYVSVVSLFGHFSEGVSKMVSIRADPHNGYATDAYSCICVLKKPKYMMHQMSFLDARQ